MPCTLALPFQLFWVYSLSKAVTGCHFCKKAMKKKHCKMDIGRENNAAFAERLLKGNRVRQGLAEGACISCPSQEHKNNKKLNFRKSS